MWCVRRACIGLFLDLGIAFISCKLSIVSALDSTRISLIARIECDAYIVYIVPDYGTLGKQGYAPYASHCMRCKSNTMIRSFDVVGAKQIECGAAHFLVTSCQHCILFLLANWYRFSRTCRPKLRSDYNDDGALTCLSLSLSYSGYGTQGIAV